MKLSGKKALVLWGALTLLLVWALRTVPLSQIGQTLRGLTATQVLILILLNILLFFLFSSRWWLILRLQGRNVPYLHLVGYRLASFAISYFTPGGQFGGEPLQIYFLRQRHQIPGPAALASVTLDKIFELLANFTFLTFGLWLVLEHGLLDGLASAPIAFLFGGLAITPLIYFALLWKGKTPLHWVVQRAPARLLEINISRRLSPLLSAAEEQLVRIFRCQPFTLVWVTGLSGLVWLLMLAEYWLVLQFLGIPLNLPQSIAALTAARIAFLTPLPGGIGALEASQVIALQALGFPPAAGLSLALLIRARDVTFGAAGLWLAGTLTRAAPVHSVPSQAGD